MAIGTGSIAGGGKFMGPSRQGYSTGQDRGQALAHIAQRKAAARAKGNEKEAAMWAMIGAAVLGTVAGIAAPGPGFAVGPALMGAAGGAQLAYGGAKLAQDDPSGAAMVISGLGTAGAGMAKYGTPKQVGFSQESIEGLKNAGVFSTTAGARAKAMATLPPELMQVLLDNPEQITMLQNMYGAQVPGQGL
jgi:hypothetical protein